LRKRYGSISILAALAVAGCASSVNRDIPAGVAALPAATQTNAQEPALAEYRIGILDELKVNIFREPELSADGVVVDVAGKINLPLLGEVAVIGKTTQDVGRDLTARLNARYLRDARVSVSVTKPTSYAFTIEGEVKQPGTFNIPGRATLLQAIAIGQGVTDRAKLREVVVFRTIGDKRYAARFDLLEIRAGRADDPALAAGDTVVVNYSAGRALYRDILQILPASAGVFVALANR
jgi:polysaccharide export outer membrane protein